jgi:hypothetical protein
MNEIAAEGVAVRGCMNQGGLMKATRRLGGAVIIAGILASEMPFAVPLEAADKKGGGDSQTATCAYLLNVINYPYVSVYVKTWAMSLYTSLGCQPALP